MRELPDRKPLRVLVLSARSKRVNAGRWADLISVGPRWALVRFHPLEEPMKVHLVRVMCAWWALCGNPASMTRPHPVLGDVPICTPCDAKVAELDAHAQQGSPR
jgi:hypothetical protein